MGAGAGLDPTAARVRGVGEALERGRRLLSKLDPGAAAARVGGAGRPGRLAAFGKVFFIRVGIRVWRLGGST